MTIALILLLTVLLVGLVAAVTDLHCADIEAIKWRNAYQVELNLRLAASKELELARADAEGYRRLAEQLRWQLNTKPTEDPNAARY